MLPPTIPGIVHAPGQPNFMNAAMFAPNVFEIDMSPDLIDELAPLALETRPVAENRARVTLSNGLRLYNDRPEHWDSDICWLSHADEASFEWFDRIFDRTGLAGLVAPFIPHDDEIRLYAGFFVTRSKCRSLNMHHDWVTKDIQALTLMAPLTANADGLGLTYRTVRGEERTYSYSLGKGIVFGPHFLHSTAIGELDERAVFLCLNFGTDRMEHWPQIAATTGNQCDLLRQPDGSFIYRADLRARMKERAAY